MYSSFYVVVVRDRLIQFLICKDSNPVYYLGKKSYDVLEKDMKIRRRRNKIEEDIQLLKNKLF